MEYKVGGMVARPVNRHVMGGNLDIAAMQWPAQGGLENPDNDFKWSAQALADLEDEIGDLFTGTILRFPGGTHMASFQWHQAIGPIVNRVACQTFVRSSGNETYRAAWGVDEMLALCSEYDITPLFTLDIVDKYDNAPLFDVRKHSNIAWISYVCGDPNDNTVIGVDAAGNDWQTVGYWANKRFQNLGIGPMNVEYWEIGNETWGYDPLSRSMGHWHYKGSFHDMAQAIRAFFPDIKLIANTAMNDRSSPVEWNVDELLEQLVLPQGYPEKYPSAIQIHPYFPWRYPQDRMDRYYDSVVNGEVLGQTVSDWLTKLASNGLGGTPLVFTEWSDPKGWAPGLDGGNYWRDGRRLQAALHYATSLMSYIRNGDSLAIATYWNVFSFNSNALLMANNAVTDAGDPKFLDMFIDNASSHIQRLFVEHFGENLMYDSRQGGSTFSFDAVDPPLGNQTFNTVECISSENDEGDVIYVIVVNRNPTYAHNVDIHLKAFSEEQQLLVESWRVMCIADPPLDHVPGTEDDFVAYNKLTWTGQSATYHREVGTVYTDLGVKKNGFRISLPPCTVTAYEIRE
jgi:hypothetical protein